MIIRGNKHTTPTDLYHIREAAEKRVLSFEKELEKAVNSWISSLNEEKYNYVGSIIEGPPPTKLTISDQINLIVSCIESYGEE